MTPLGLIAGAMLIFLNYEGFELIANASKTSPTRKRSLPIAYIGGVADRDRDLRADRDGRGRPPEFRARWRKVSDRALSVAAQRLAWAGRVHRHRRSRRLLATSSAINATFYGTGRLTYIIAEDGELPTELERSIRGQHLEGTLITAALALVVANFVPLEAIATMGSAGFLLLFMAVNVANVRLARETGSRAWMSGVGGPEHGRRLGRALRRGGRESGDPKPPVDPRRHDRGVVRDRDRLSRRHGASNPSGSKAGRGQCVGGNSAADCAECDGSIRRTPRGADFVREPGPIVHRKETKTSGVGR